MKEEGFESLKSMAVLAIMLGCAFTVAAMVPPAEVTSEEISPLEVQKTRIEGPAVVVVNTPMTWILEITVTNHLEPLEIGPIDSGDENDYYEPVVYNTRGEGESVVCPRTIYDVTVTDVFTSEFVLVDSTPSQGELSIRTDESGATHIIWQVGALPPQSSAYLELTVATAGEGFAKIGSRILNSGASASGLLPATRKILTDGPTKPIFVTVTDGEKREPPVADAGIAQMAFVDNPVYLDGSGSYDIDGTVIKYTWFLGDELIGTSRSVLTYLPVGVHEVTLIVEDNHRLSDSDTVTVTIYEENAKIEGGVMYGVVRDATTQRGFDPYIVVSNENYAISTWTDMGGNYRIIGLPAGHYEVSCQTEGYRDFHGEVTIRENAEVHYPIDMVRR
ncbi:MAG: hypothetical protein JSW28_00310 [Thermoplasmata archaeon]|nr:MAG: hypothetical protein JSW28_00310 [Thermoplasmata archaeon]